MIGFTLVMDGDGAFPELAEGNFQEGVIEKVSMLQMGMSSGKPSVGLLIKLPDGSYTFAQTSLALFANAAKAFTARYEMILEGQV